MLFDAIDDSFNLTLENEPKNEEMEIETKEEKSKAVQKTMGDIFAGSA